MLFVLQYEHCRFVSMTTNYARLTGNDRNGVTRQRRVNEVVTIGLQSHSVCSEEQLKPAAATDVRERCKAQCTARVEISEQTHTPTSCVISKSRQNCCVRLAPVGPAEHSLSLAAQQLCSPGFQLGCTGVNDTDVRLLFITLVERNSPGRGIVLAAFIDRHEVLSQGAALALCSSAKVAPPDTQLLAESWIARVGRCGFFHTTEPDMKILQCTQQSRTR